MPPRYAPASLACNVFLSDLTLEFDAVGAVLGHGFHPWKARRPRSIPNPRPVHRQGRTPPFLTLEPVCCGEVRPAPNGTGNHHPDDGSNSVILHLTKEWPEQNSQSAPVEQAQTPTPHQERAKKMNEVGSASFAIRMRYKGEERTTELPLTHDMITQLAFEAGLRNMRIGELIGELMVAMLKKDLFQTVLQREEPK